MTLLCDSGERYRSTTRTAPGCDNAIDTAADEAAVEAFFKTGFAPA